MEDGELGSKNNKSRRRSDMNENLNASGERESLKRAREENIFGKEFEDEAEIQSVMKFARFLEEKGYIRQRSPERSESRRDYNDNNKKKTESRGKKQLQQLSPMEAEEDNGSEVTIYRRAVPLLSELNEPKLDNQKLVNRISTSSEEDQSGDENQGGIRTTDVSKNQQEINDALIYEKFVDCHLREHRRESSLSTDRWNYDDLSRDEEPQPSTSRDQTENRRGPTLAVLAEEKTREMIRKAEVSKASMLQVPGKRVVTKEPIQVFSSNDLLHSVVVDEGYSAIGRHIDESVKRRIQEGEFIDFARLIPKDRVLALNDNQIEIVNNNGKPELRTVSDSEVIGSFNKLEQAFRIFSTIYTDHYPERAKQLLQYSHIIFSASLMHSWSNVYVYDIDFHLHIAENPGRNWGIILQQAWTLHMKERLGSYNRNNSSFSTGAGNNNSGNGTQCKSGSGKNCWKYNRGKCTYGFGCKFEHQCGICNKFGHGAHICRKGQQNNSRDREDDRDRRNEKGDKKDFFKKR